MSKIFGTGIDIIEISRIKEAIDRWGDTFLSHVFTKEEIVYAKKHRFPNQHFAARFAAKEAVLKAFGNNAHINWKDIQITNDKHGKPVCIYLPCRQAGPLRPRSEASRQSKDKEFKKQILVSISHTKNYAVASAIITS